MKRKKIGVILPRSVGHCRNVIRGVYRYANTQLDWDLVHHDALKSSTVEALAAASIHGAVVLAHYGKAFQELESLGVPLVNVSSYEMPVTLSSVLPDDVQAGIMAAQYFITRGFRNFGYVSIPMRSGYPLWRGEGFKRCLFENGLSCAERVYWEPDPTGRLTHEELTARWLLDLPTPCAIFVCCDSDALPLARVAVKAGIQIPDEIAIMGVDDDDMLCTLSSPSLSSVALPGQRMGYEAARVLQALLADPSSPAINKVLRPTGISVRQSTEVFAVEDPALQRALRFIREHLHEVLTVADVAAHVGMNRRSLEIKFRRSMGQSPHDAIRSAQMSRAQRLLTDTDLPLSDVAEKCGFRSLPRFSVVFKEQVGQPPSEYRASQSTFFAPGSG